MVLKNVFLMVTLNILPGSWFWDDLRVMGLMCLHFLL